MPFIDGPVIKRLADVWHGVVDQGSIVGGVLVVAQEGEIRYASARGWADRESRITVERDTRFRLASLTKLLTSVTALRLCELGVLSLEAPVTTWLKDFRPQLADGREPVITLRHLLSHTAGLSYGFEQPPGNAYALAGVSDGLDLVAMDLQQNLQRLASVPLLFEPGMAWGYSLATDVVGAVIEQATDLALPQAIARWVTEPLAMNATGFSPDDDQRLASAYKDGRSGPERVGRHDLLALDSGHAWLSSSRAFEPEAYASGGAGMLGTADDYLRLLECLRLGGSPILTAASTASLLGNAIGETGLAGRGAGWKFGLGPVVLTDPALAKHPQSAGTWSWCGLYGCHYWVDPQAGISLVALTNTAVAGAWGVLADGLVGAIYQGHESICGRQLAGDFSV
ncbi:serine hydrolase domain-containing protein [Pseudomonas lijiangensis]|uniref:Beta-lactamase family protein n=1 Tax=Pseudomonas lijiangensis TaxID=2995658 RepID=A0ABX8HLM1_9PSED|nr:serine hydrolase domain-containing protein [Pseudomonas lijiangensis]MBX8498476.1 beta-lactamase family protein [Pseudomonas lijiangensis]MBX8503383.1 beta-lactamase family protein [Pseudomonas lijiangensis]QWU81020.1 beta-lactamase family protein [Pseudomonas lijiangensis]